MALVTCTCMGERYQLFNSKSFCSKVKWHLNTLGAICHFLQSILGLLTESQRFCLRFKMPRCGQSYRTGLHLTVYWIAQECSPHSCAEPVQWNFHGLKLQWITPKVVHTLFREISLFSMVPAWCHFGKGSLHYFGMIYSANWPHSVHCASLCISHEIRVQCNIIP